MQQITIYDLLDEPIPKAESQKTRIDTGDWCLVYMVTRHGGYQGNLYMLHREDAIKLCSDDCSRGRGQWGEWMFCWTSMDHFAKDDDAAIMHKNVHSKLEPFEFIRDSGKQDDDFKRLGIIKPELYEMEEELKRMGFELKRIFKK